MTISLVSVVVPAYNAGRFLRATGESILNQSYQHWECVIVDDGSVDDTLEVAATLEQMDGRFRVVAQENSGASAARNAGFKATSPRSEFVTFMDSDDIWLPHALQVLIDAIARDPGAIGAHGLAEMVDQGGNIMDAGSYPAVGRRRLGLEGRRLIEWPLDRPTDFRVLVNGNVLFPPGLVLARRIAYERVGPFDEGFNGAEDWDMLIRLSRLGHFAFRDEVILHYRRHASNLGAQAGIEQQAWFVRCKAFHSPENTPKHRRIARLGWRAYQWDMVVRRLRSALVQASGLKAVSALQEFARATVSLARYVRGYPVPKIVRGSPGW